MKEKVNVKKLREGAKIPCYGSAFAAGADLYACTEQPIEIKSGQTVLVATGIAMEIPEGYAGLIYARSARSLMSSARLNKIFFGLICCKLP